MPAALHLDHAQRQVAVLHDIGQILGTDILFEEALRSILKLLCDRMEMDLGTISLLGQEENEVAIDIAYGLSRSEIKRGRYKIGEGITGKVVESGKPVIVPRISSEPLFLDRTGAPQKDQEIPDFLHLRARNLAAEGHRHP